MHVLTEALTRTGASTRGPSHTQYSPNQLKPACSTRRPNLHHDTSCTTELPRNRMDARSIRVLNVLVMGIAPLPGLPFTAMCHNSSRSIRSPLHHHNSAVRR